MTHPTVVGIVFVAVAASEGDAILLFLWSIATVRLGVKGMQIARNGAVTLASLVAVIVGDGLAAFSLLGLFLYFMLSSV